MNNPGEAIQGGTPKGEFEDAIAEANKEGEGLDQAACAARLVEKIRALDSTGDVKVISLIGGAGAGKSTLAQKLVEALQSGGATAACISTDGFVVGTRDERRLLEQEKGPLAKYDFGHLNRVVGQLRRREDVRVPTYDEATGLAIAQGEEKYVLVSPAEYIIVEGDFDTVENPGLRIYLHVADETRLENRVTRDLEKRGESDREKISANFHLRQELQHIPHTLPAVRRADVIIDAVRDGAEYRYALYTARAKA